MIEQFVPQEACLGCHGCCRFSQEDSAWTPCLLDEEMQNLLDREKELPSVFISSDKRIKAKPNPQGPAESAFICPFLDIRDNKCKIYAIRPFECQLYPFLLDLRIKKVILTVDLKCPYIKEKIATKELKEYTDYLAAFLNSPKQLKTLKDNPQIIQAYQEVMDIVELNIPDETE